MKNRTNHNNDHRKSKISFQVMMPVELARNVEKVKAAKAIDTNSALLRTLIEKEVEKIDKKARKLTK